MNRRLLYFIAGFLKCRLIQSDNGKPYLERYFIGKLFGRYYFLHRFVHPHADEWLHDHPVDEAISLVLAGGYRERRARLAGRYASRIDGYDKIVDLVMQPDRFVTRRNILQRGDFHQIVEIEPETWTLFSHGEWTSDWGAAVPLDDHFSRQLRQNVVDIRRFAYRIIKGRPGWWLDKGVRRGWKAGREPFKTN